jgi:glutathione S-transferase
VKLYYTPGACSLAPHISLRESGLPFEVEKVADLGKKKLDGDRDYYAVNPKGQVPTLVLDDGSVLTENAAIGQYIGDKAQGKNLVPAAGSMERYRLQEWMSFVGSELHKTFGPLFSPAAGDDLKKAFKDRLTSKIAYLDKHLANHQYLMGDHFTVADAYAYAVLRWHKRIELDISQFKNVVAFMDRMAARPAVKEALKVEGLA